MRAALLLLAAALPAAADTASKIHDQAREAYDRTLTVMQEGNGLVRELEALKGRYREEDDLSAVGAERDVLRKRIEDVQKRYLRLRVNLLELRKSHQSGQLERLLGGPAKDDFAQGLMEALDINRYLDDIQAFPKRVETALQVDEADFSAARLDAAAARQRRLLTIAVGAMSAVTLIALAAVPVRRPLRVRLPPPDQRRLE